MLTTILSLIEFILCLLLAVYIFVLTPHLLSLLKQIAQLKSESSEIQFRVLNKLLDKNNDSRRS